MPKSYPQALREQIVLEFHQGRSIRALANAYEPCEVTIRQWIERASGGAQLDASEADELKRLRKENRQLREDKLILEKAASGLVREPSQRTVAEVRTIYQFMQANQARKSFTVTAMVRVFRVNRRAYYAWCQRQRWHE